MKFHGIKIIIEIIKRKQNKTKQQKNECSFSKPILQIEVNVLATVNFFSWVIFVLGYGNVC